MFQHMIKVFVFPSPSGNLEFQFYLSSLVGIQCNLISGQC